MKAVVKLASGPDQIRHLDWDKPVPGPGQALLKVLAVGVCGSDVHILHGRFGGDPPFILGHEFLGQIAEPGPGASCWRKGQRVVAENISGACGICMLCRTGRGYLCPEKRAYGSRSHGAMAEWTVMPAQALHAVPDSIADEDAALTEPLAIACHAALTRGGVGFGEKVLVIGPGPIGLLAVRVAALSGAHLAILGAAEDASRLEMGRSMGAELVLSAADPQWRSRLERWRPGQPIDCVIEL
ncbi:MAG: alcohol dehydrogenase catalytic domain-containing protein, partial [Elusimicrobia bacterium]|nr:alcohol dehydrogenase catalytic domain-containing protein [Elusimicrobiota bacterium]